MRYKIFTFLLLAGFCLVGPLSSSESEEQEKRCSSFYLNVDFLFEQACIDDLEYAAVRTATSPDTFTIYTIDLDWIPAFRIQIGSKDLFCGWELCGSYIYRKIDDDSHVSSNPSAIVSPVFHADLSGVNLGDFALGNIEAQYHEWEILMGRDLLCIDCHHMMVYFGIAGLYLDQNVNSIVSDGTDEIMETIFESEYWGVGVRLGGQYRWEFCDCWTLFSQGYATILAGEADNQGFHDDDDSGTSPDFIYSDNTICQIVHGYKIGFGLEYEWCHCGVPIVLKLGYDFQLWQNVPNHRIFVGDDLDDEEATISTSSNTRTIGFHGISLGIGLSY